VGDQRSPEGESAGSLERSDGHDARRKRPAT
jgi:hypothetical protein